MGTAGLAINQTYDIWISVESDGAPLILNINNYWEFTMSHLAKLHNQTPRHLTIAA